MQLNNVTIQSSEADKLEYSNFIIHTNKTDLALETKPTQKKQILNNDSNGKKKCTAEDASFANSKVSNLRWIKNRPAKQITGTVF